MVRFTRNQRGATRCAACVTTVSLMAVTEPQPDGAERSGSPVPKIFWANDGDRTGKNGDFVIKLGQLVVTGTMESYDIEWFSIVFQKHLGGNFIIPTRWGPQDSVQLPNISGFMADITIVNRG